MKLTARSTRRSQPGLPVLLGTVRSGPGTYRIDVRRGDRPYELVVYGPALTPEPGNSAQTVTPPDEPTRATT